MPGQACIDRRYMFPSRSTARLLVARLDYLVGARLLLNLRDICFYRCAWPMKEAHEDDDGFGH